MERHLQSPPLESSWPGEREPSIHDVQVANESPEPAFLAAFKRSILASSEAAGNQSLMHLDLQVREHRSQGLQTSKSILTASQAYEPGKYTWPLAILSDFPEKLPPPDEMVYLREVFSKCCPGHPFLERLPIAPPSHTTMAPPLHFAIGCMASIHARREPDEAANLFMASRGLWGVTMECDNREARSVELLVTVCMRRKCATCIDWLMQSCSLSQLGNFRRFIWSVEFRRDHARQSRHLVMFRHDSKPSSIPMKHF